LERFWQEKVDLDLISLMSATHFANGQQYKLSVPLKGDLQNEQAYVYDYTRETEGNPEPGSWSRFDNHQVVNWANLNWDSYWSSVNGQVFSIRRLNDDSDYRDDAAAIEAVALLRPLDFGDAGIRKSIGAIITTLRAVGDIENVKVYQAIDLSDEFVELDEMEVSDQKPSLITGLSDTVGSKGSVLKNSLRNRKCVYLQLKYVSSGKDEPFELSGVTIRVFGASHKGLSQSANSTK
jgi:hypothetical protein